MKILIGCRLPEDSMNELRALAADVLYEPELTTPRMERLISDVGVLAVARTRVPPEAITAAKALQLIVCAGTDTSNIAMAEASAQGVFVCNCPNKAAPAIAELGFGLLLALDRRLLKNATVARKGVPEHPEPPDALGLAGCTLGVIASGAVEQEIVKRARAFEMNVLAWSPTVTPEQVATRHVELCTWPRELARRSHMVIVYAPQPEADELLVNREFIENMRDGAYIVYVGHPAALDQAALVEVAEKRSLRIAYDVSVSQLVSSKAERFKARLQALPDVIGTHHLAERTQQAETAIAEQLVRVVREFLVAGEVLNCVNLLERSPATWQLVLRLKDAVGVLASVLDHIRADGINVEEIISRVFTGAQAGCCTIALDERPSTAALNAIRELDGVLNVELRALV